MRGLEVLFTCWVSLGGRREHTNIVPTHIGSLGAHSEVNQRASVGLLATRNLVLAAVGHGVGELHVVVDGLVDLVVWSGLLIDIPMSG